MKEVRRRLRAAIAQAQRNGEDLEAIQDALCGTMEKLKGFKAKGPPVTSGRLGL